jgi:hypothetical protein
MRMHPRPPGEQREKGLHGAGPLGAALGRRPESSARKGRGTEIPGVLQTTSSTKVFHMISMHLFTPFGLRT